MGSQLEKAAVALQVEVMLLSRRLPRRTDAIRSPGAAQRGQGLVEYTVIVALIVLASIAAVTQFSQGIATTFQKILGHVTAIPGL